MEGGQAGREVWERFPRRHTFQCELVVSSGVQPRCGVFFICSGVFLLHVTRVIFASMFGVFNPSLQFEFDTSSFLIELVVFSKAIGY